MNEYKYNGVKVVPVYSSEEIIDIISSKLNDMQLRIDRLTEENKKLKEDIWEKEEVAKLKAENERLRKESYNGFPISDDELKLINDFIKKHNNPPMKINSCSYTYKFTPTSLGTIGTISYMNGLDELTFRELN